MINELTQIACNTMVCRIKYIDDKFTISAPNINFTQYVNNNYLNKVKIFIFIMNKVCTLTNNSNILLHKEIAHATQNL